MVTIADINKATKDCFDKAAEIFGVDLSATVIEYNLRGRARGQARWKNSINGAHTFKLRYNKEAILLDGEGVINETVPHEVAHLVCRAMPHLGKNHNRGWKNVCIRLGGTGVRCHKLKLTPGRRTKRYMYIATCGAEVEISSVRHGKIQKRGVVYRMRNARGKLDRTCEYRRVA